MFVFEQNSTFPKFSHHFLVVVILSIHVDPKNPWVFLGIRSLNFSHVPNALLQVSTVGASSIVGRFNEIWGDPEVDGWVGLVMGSRVANQSQRLCT